MEFVNQSVVVFILAILPLFGVTFALGLISLLFQSLTLVRDEIFFTSIRILLIFLCLYFMLPAMTPSLQDLLRESFLLGK